MQNGNPVLGNNNYMEMQIKGKEISKCFKTNRERV
jgi:hypothetical protein